MMDFARARRFMVDGQLRPNQVQDPRLISAFGDLPREAFLPAPLAPRAYADAGRAREQGDDPALAIEYLDTVAREPWDTVAAGTWI